MQNRIKIILATFSLYLAAISHATAEGPGAAPVKVAFTFSMPPYLSKDMSAGIELDIIKNALGATGHHNVEVQNIHYRRAIELAKSGEVDLIASNKSNDLYARELPQVYASDTTIHYVDCAISLRSRELDLDDIEGFYDKRIWAFKSASLSLGEDFHKMTIANPKYTEDFDQQKQLEMLTLGRIDVAISDRNIFAYKLGTLDVAQKDMFAFSPLGKPTPRVVRSSNKQLIDHINKGLKRARANGDYQKMLGNYLGSYVGHCN